MKAIILSFLFIIALNAQPYHYTFSELKGLEDNEGNTHLFYRLYYYKDNPVLTRIENSIYHLDLNNNVDTLFIFDGGWFPDDVRYISDYDIFSLETNKFAFCGSYCVVECVPFISLRDSIQSFETGWGSSHKVKFGSNDSLVYYGLDSYIFQPPVFPQLATFKSTDGGYNWELLSADKIFFSLSPYDNNISFYIDKFSYRTYKSTNGGNQFYLVDTLVSIPSNTSFFYDFDKNHIYKTTYNGIYSLVVSNNFGEPFTWSIKYQSNNRIFISIDSGSIYLADGRRIYISEDYGLSFSEYKILDTKIVGIYKKPNSDKLYAATKYNLFEITPDTIIVIKSLPIDPKEFEWFPLSITNKWIYDNRWYGDLGDSARWISKWEVINHRVIDNKVFAEILITDFENYSSVSPDAGYKYFRVDSSAGLVYQAVIENDTVTYEELYMDLLAEAGDTIQVGNGIYLDSDIPFNQFSISSRKRTFLHVLTPAQQIELVKGFGLVYDFWWELIEFRKTLKGCIIDGIVYGDTNTVVSVNDFNENIPTEFSLSQNYPNPFNPTTKIKFTIPSNVILSEAKNLFVTLKVFDVLGREVTTLVNEEKQPGVYEAVFDASGLASGIYYYQLKAGSYTETRKMILLR